MATYIKLALDKRRLKADNTYPIVFKITHNRIPTTIATDYCVETKFWDDKSLVIKNSCKSIKHVSSVNLLLKQRETNMHKAIIGLDNDDLLGNLTIAELVSKLKFVNSVSTHTFASYTELTITNFKVEGKHGNASCYQDALNFIKKYNKTNEILFNKITSKFLFSLQNKYMSKPENHYNGLSVYMRTIRAIYNRAISDDIIDVQNYPFSRRAGETAKYKIRNEKTRKRAIPKEYIQKIESYIAPEKSSKLLIDAKHFFLFSFYMRGINFVDMANLTVSNIKNGDILVYKRSKTGRTYEIKINDKAMDILVYYGLKNKYKRDLLLPIVKRVGNVSDIHKDIKNTTKTTNKYLKVIANELELNINLTMYVGRHSWATIADKAGVDRRVISKGLGHADLQTTEIYIDDLVSSTDLEDADDLIIR